MFLDRYIQVLWYLNIAATAVLLVKMWKEELLVRYKALSSYLVWDLATALILVWVPLTRNLYAKLYFSFQGLTWVLYVLTTLELFTHVLKQYPGFAVFGRRLVTFALAVSVSIALLSMIAGINADPSAPWQTQLAMNLFLLGRVVCLTVLSFVGLSACIFLWFPLPLPANSTRFLFGYSLCFLARTILMFTLNQRGFRAAPLLNALTLTVVAGCLIYWIFQLRKAGETATLSLSRRWTAEEQQRVLDQIQSINSSLMQSRRK